MTRSSQIKVIPLVSGGLDSVTSLYHAADRYEVPAVLSFDYGAKHHQQELMMASYHCQKLGLSHITIPLRFMDEFFESDLLLSGGEIPEGHYEAANMKQTVVPFRNGIMLSVAAGFAESQGAEGVMISAHAGDHAIYPDCREDFLHAMADAIDYGTYAKIKLLRPFVHLHKSDIVKRGMELGVEFSKTWSCYKGGERHCGRCGTCVERREAFILAKLPDPTEYQHEDPLPLSPSFKSKTS